jgi:ACS family sodium-dependent inorganic phosphate cotransporter
VHAQVLSAFYYGYILTQFLGARLSALYGGRRVLLGALFGWSTLTLATPTLCRASVLAAAVARALLGLFEGAT